MSSSFPPTTLLLTFLFLFLRLLTLTTFVSCDTQMCRRFSRTAETTPVPPTNTSCIRAQLTPGPRYNSLIIYVEISRKSRECAVPKDHPFYLSLQVINEHGYPVGDPKEGFTQSNTPETSCDPPPPDITSHYAKDGEFKMIPCFFDYEYSHKYRQNASKTYHPGVLALFKPTATEISLDLFHFRAMWYLTTQDLSKEVTGSLVSKLFVLGEIFSPNDDKYLQFTSLNWASLSYKHDGDRPPTTSACSKNPTVFRLTEGPFPYSSFVSNPARYFNSARKKPSEFDYSIPNFSPSLPVPSSELEYKDSTHYTCLRLQKDVFRIAENPDSLKCIKLFALPSVSGDNTAFIVLSYIAGSDQVACARWRTSEWTLQAYNSYNFLPSGDVRYPGSFYHYSGGAGLSYRFRCDASSNANFLKVLEHSENLRCPYVNDISKFPDWRQEVSATNTPFMFHAKSREFYETELDGSSVYFIWKFEVLRKLITTSPTGINFIVEAYLPYQNLVLVLLAQRQLRLQYKATIGNEALNPTKSCLYGQPTKTMEYHVPPIRVIDYPDTKYVKAACDQNLTFCDDMSSPRHSSSDSSGGSPISCREWRSSTKRTEVIGDCFALINSPARQENSVLLTLRLESACLPEFTVEDFAIGAYNELGFPVGKVGESFSVYEGQDSQQCVDSWDIKDYNQGHIDSYTNYDCFYDESQKDKFIQEVNKTSVPTFFYGKSSDSTIQDKSARYFYWRIVWEYAQPPDYVGKHPETILFEAEVYIPLRSQVLIVLSKDPILFKYIPSPPDNPPGTPCNATFSPKSSVIVKIQPVRGNSSTANPDPTYLRNCHNHVNCSVPSVYILPTPTGPPGSTNPDPPPVVIEPGPPIEPNPIVQGKPTPRPDWVPKIKKPKRPSNVYDGCVERTKGCIVPPKGSEPRLCLKSKSCDLVIAFQRQDMVDTNQKSEDFVVLEMYHFDPGEWFAVGLNPSAPRMADSFVLECVDEGHVNGPTVYNSRNLAGGAYSNQRYPEDGPERAQLIVDLQESYKRNHEIYCRFHIKVQFRRSAGEAREKRFFDLHKMPFYVVAAWGSEYFVGAHGNLKRHKPYHFMIPPEGTNHKTILGARYAPTPAQKPLIISHGMVMLWVILFCLPIGSFIARFCKETLPTIKLFKRIPLWLSLHIGVMTLGLILFIYATWSEVEGHKNWVSLRKSSVHTWLGGTTGGLFLLNFLIGCATKVTTHGKRNAMGVGHGFLGHGLFILGISLILRMDDVSFGNAPCFTKYIAIGLIFTYIAIYGVVTYHYSWVDWIVGLKSGRGAFGIMPIGVLTEKVVTEIVEKRKSRNLHTRDYFGDKNKDEVIAAPGRRVRLGALGLLTFLCLMYVLWMSLIILTNKRGPCIPLDKFKD